MGDVGANQELASDTGILGTIACAGCILDATTAARTNGSSNFTGQSSEQATYSTVFEGVANLVD